MGYKMLVLDLDDTLLNDQYQISEKNRLALLGIQAKGVKVVLASGRPTPAMLKYADILELGKNESFILSYNGGSIMDMSQKRAIFEQCLTINDVHTLYDFSRLNNTDIITYQNDRIITEGDSEYAFKEREITGMPLEKVKSFKSNITESVVKCILLQEPSYLQCVREKLIEEIPHLSVAISKPYFLEVTQTGIDKAASLSRLADILGIRQQEIVAVGNAQNDLSMIQYAGLGIWVDNVSDELRDLADYVVSSNNDDGVSEVVERFF